MRIKAGWDAPIALFLGLAVTCVLGWTFKAHCLVDGIWYDLIQYTTGCYSDAVPFWHLRGVAAGQVPYLQTQIEYPVLTGALIWFEGAVTRVGFGAAANAGSFLAVVALVNSLLAFMVLAMLRRFDLPRGRLWAWAVSPVLLVYLGANWDMLAVAFSVAALLMARRDRLVLAGLLVGLGTSAKLYPALLVPILCLQALLAADGRAVPARFGRAIAVGLATLAAWGAVNAPVALAAFENWSEFYRFSAERGTTSASVWEILGAHGWFNPSHELRNRLAMALVVAGSAAIVALGWRRHGAHAWTLFTPVLAWFIFVNKVYSPQFDLWLYPLLLLTIPRLAPIAIFAAGSVLAFYSELLWFGFQEGAWLSLDRWALEVCAALRAVGIFWIIASGMFDAPPPWISRAKEARDDYLKLSPSR